MLLANRPQRSSGNKRTDEQKDLEMIQVFLFRVMIWIMIGVTYKYYEATE